MGAQSVDAGQLAARAGGEERNRPQSLDPANSVLVLAHGRSSCGVVVVMDGTDAQLGGLCEGAGGLQSDANQPFARLGASSDGPGVGMLRVRVCGGVEIEAQGRVLPDVLLAGRQGRLVLAYLVCERPRAVWREELAELLWADRLPDSWPASLSAVISRLRRLFGEAGLDGTSVLLSSAGTYQVHLP